MRIVITGSDGLIGSKLVQRCSNLGMEVIGLDLRSGHDIRSERIIDVVPSDVDVLVHLAGLSDDRQCANNAYECFDINVLGTLNLMRVASKKNIRQFVFASTEWVYDSCSEFDVKTEESPIFISRHTSEYALSKLVSETNLRQQYFHGFCPTTILRFGIVCGSTRNRMTAVESLFFSVKDKDTLSVGSLASGRCFIHVEDIVSGIIVSFGRSDFEIFNLVGDRIVTLGEIIESARSYTGRSPIVTETAASSPSVRAISNRKARERLNWRPTIHMSSWIETLSAIKDI